MDRNLNSQVNVGSLDIGYFNWLCDIVCKDRFHKDISYEKLLVFLHQTRFTYIDPMDGNRAGDGISLRYRYLSSVGDAVNSSGEFSHSPCTVLEMIIALAIRCEETIMDDPSKGDRTGQWFWKMINTLGLSSMSDNNFDRNTAYGCVEKFLNRKYEPNGAGGLFKIKNCDLDLREMEIWKQLLLYLDSII